MPDFSVTTLDIVVLVVYVLGTRIALGWYLAWKTRSEGSEGYFLAGRNISWFVVGLSFYVANMSGSTFVALPASGYHDGIAAYNYEWIPAFILVLFAVFFLPYYLKVEIYTAPEFLERRYDRRSRYAFSAFLLVANIFIDAAAALYAGATVLQVIFPRVPFSLTVLAISSIAGVYIFFGGLRAVVINDAIQAVMIFFGGAVIAVMVYMKIPSWQAVVEASPPEALSLVRPADDPTMPWPGMLTGVLVIGIYFWCANQFIIQRALGARNLDHGRWGAIFAGLLKLPNLFILLLPGVMATALYPKLERPDLVFPTLAFDILPVGFRGLMLAALAAAILSSLEAIFNSASTLFTMDFVKTMRPKTSDDRLVTIGRIATLVFMLLAAAWAPQIRHFPTLWQYLQSILAYVTPPVVAVFFLGIFWKRASARAGFATLALGIPLGITGWVLAEVAGVVEFPYLYAAGVMLLLSAAITAVVSWAGPEPDYGRIRDSVYRRGFVREAGFNLPKRPWYLDYRYQSAGLLALTTAIVIWWW